LLKRTIPKFNELLKGTSLTNTSASTKATQQVEEAKKNENVKMMIPPQMHYLHPPTSVGGRHGSFA